MLSSIPGNKIREIAKEISHQFSDQQYAIRGTAGLVLQGYDMGVGDIDILCDSATAKKLGMSYSESPKYKSYFGSVEILGEEVE